MTNQTTYKYSITKQKLVEFGENQLKGPDNAFEFIKSIGIHKEEQEHFVVLFLNTKNRIIGYSLIYIGTIDEVHSKPREIFRAAIINNTVKIILSHNHPSEDLYPSKNDIRATKKLQEAGQIIGIEILDHIIVSEKGHYSMRDHSLM